jgi:hypothetical protein
MFTIVSVILRLFEVGNNLQWYLMEGDDGIGEIIGLWRSLQDLHVGRSLRHSQQAKHHIPSEFFTNISRISDPHALMHPSAL